MRKVYRQGDVLFIAAKRQSGQRAVRQDGIIMHGEATGHAHRIADLTEAEVYDIGDRCYLSVSAEGGGVSIVHDEHLPITLPRGHYQVRQQREYRPEGIQNVRD